MKKNSTILTTLIVLALIIGPPLLIFLISHFQYDSQIEGNPYKVVFENNGKSYELSIQGSSLAFDRGTGDDQLYLNSFYDLGNLIGLSYNDFKIDPTNNPFFAGKITVDNAQKYYNHQTKYSTPKDSYQSYTFYDQNRDQIFSYDPTMESEFVVKLLPTFPLFSKSRYSSGGMKQNYVNVTKFFKEKLNRILKIRTDETNKLLILSFEN